MPKINIAELLADREANHGARKFGEFLASRIERLPDLEAAFIEAVEALRTIKRYHEDFYGSVAPSDYYYTIVRTTLERIINND